MIRLFSPSETSFASNGLGALTEATSCVVSQALNGAYELKMTYPATGRRYDQIGLRSIVVAPVDPVSDPQPFRIYRITQPLNGIVTIYARHLAYDLMGIVLVPFTAPTLRDTLAAFVTSSASSNPFTFDTDKLVASPFTLTKPTAIWNALSGQQGSLLDVYGGEFEFDKWSVYLHGRRGMDRGVTIAYGKNLTSYQQDQNNANVYTGVYPYWANEETSVTLPERVLYAEGSYDFERILALDLTSYFTEAPSEEELRARAEAYMAANNIGVPVVSWKISFAQLEQSGEYQSTLTRVLLGDTVHVRFPMYNVTASARAVSIQYNALLKRYDTVTLGSVKANLAQTIAVQAKEIEERPTTTGVSIIAEALTKGLLGANDGIIRWLDTNNDGAPDELYIADNPNPAQAVKVWRYNFQGFAASSTGYAGPYKLGATLEDGLLADFVTAANLVAGTIRSADGSTFFLDLDNGILDMDAHSISIGGQDMSVIISGYTTPMQADIDDLKAHIVIGSDGSMTFIGSDGNPITLRLVNDQLGIYNGSDLIDSFAASGTMTQNLTIPDGGSLSMGNFKWVPRSSGSLDLMWVG